MPEAFYKYMPYSTAEIVLRNQTLRWTTPATLNDPYDIQFDLRIDIDRELALQLALDKLWKLINKQLEYNIDNPMHRLVPDLQRMYQGQPRDIFTQQMSGVIRESLAALDGSILKIREETRALLSTVKILCLTDSPANQLMWAYYADSNKGAVLRFQNVPGAGSPYQMAKPMNYHNELPMLFDEEGFSRLVSGLNRLDTKEIFNNLIYTKSNAWSHEREWRICSGDGRDRKAPHEDLPFGSRELTGVIFGCRMPAAERETLIEILEKSYPHTELLQATPASHRYNLEISRIER